MDIFRFVNSKDVREHLRDIGYEFNSLEAAWLIYQCRDAAIDEKHKAWNELIATMPDCPIEKRTNTAAQDSLHAFLRQCMSNYMNLEFYDKELTGPKRTLIALSNFLKDEIDPVLFARAYHQIITAGYAENSIPLDYMKSGMILAGLSKPDHIKLWLDDVREAPEGYCHCHSVNEAKEKIIECEKEFIVIDEIDCDHDLGAYASDGGDGIKLIDWLAERKTYYPVRLHTMNPVGRENMQREIDRYWNARK